MDEDGYTNQYIALVKRNTSTNDSFYFENHGFPENQKYLYPLLMVVKLDISMIIHEPEFLYSGTFYINRIDDNRFRIKTSTGSSPVRLRYATGNITFTGIINNTTKNSFYIQDNLFSNGELMSNNYWIYS